MLNNYFSSVPEEERKSEYVKIFSNLARVLRNDYPSLKKLMDGVRV